MRSADVFGYGGGRERPMCSAAVAAEPALAPARAVLELTVGFRSPGVGKVTLPQQ